MPNDAKAQIKKKISIYSRFAMAVVHDHPSHVARANALQDRCVGESWFANRLMPEVERGWKRVTLRGGKGREGA